MSELVRGARDAARVALAKTPEQLAVLDRPAWSIAAAPGCAASSTRCATSSPATSCPLRRALDTIEVHVARGADAGTRDRRPALRGHVPARRRRRQDARVSEVWAGLGDSIVIVGGDGSITATSTPTTWAPPSRRPLTPVGLARSASPTSPNRSSRSAGFARRPPRALERRDDARDDPTDDRGRRGRGGRGDRAHLSLARRAPTGRRRPVDEPVDRRARRRRSRDGLDEVIILPNNKNVTPVAEQVNGLVDQHVAVVATNSIVEGFAALLAYDPDAVSRRQRHGDEGLRVQRRRGRSHPRGARRETEAGRCTKATGLVSGTRA